MIRNKPLLAIPFTSTRGMFFSLLSNISKLLNSVRPNIFDDNAIPPEPFTPFFFRDRENDDGSSTLKKKNRTINRYREICSTGSERQKKNKVNV